MGGTYPFKTASATIANGASLSAAVCIGGADLVAVEMPAGWTAASLTFQGSADGVTFNNIYDDGGNEVTLTVAASRHVAIGEGTGAKAEHFRGAPFLKVRSGTSGSPVAQGADRVLTLVSRALPIPAMR